MLVRVSRRIFSFSYLGFIKPSSTPSAMDFTALDISCLDVYARHTFKVALKKKKNNVKLKQPHKFYRN